MNTKLTNQQLADVLSLIDDPGTIRQLLEIFRPAELEQLSLLPPPNAQPAKRGNGYKVKYHHKKAWGRGEVRQLARMVEEGATIADMATTFGRSKKAISTAIKRHVDRNPKYWEVR